MKLFLNKSSQLGPILWSNINLYTKKLHAVPDCLCSCEDDYYISVCYSLNPPTYSGTAGGSQTLH